MHCTRREFLAAASVTAAAGTWPHPRHLAAREKPRALDNRLAKEVGITTSSVGQHVSLTPTGGQISLWDLPKVMRQELDMRVIDLNTGTLGSLEPAHAERFGQAADKAGCVIINLKMNQRGLDMNSADAAVRGEAMRQYKQSIDAASRMGARWARPLPLAQRPDMDRHVAAYRQLADYAAGRNVQMLVENFGWMDSDPQSVVKLIKAIDRDVAACPDTGNWSSDEVRWAGLAATFPLAVTCDFKARKLGPAGQHPLYNLERCFRIGWEAGFRGPWCLEHAHADRKTLFGELALLRDMLRKWMAG